MKINKFYAIIIILTMVIIMIGCEESIIYNPISSNSGYIKHQNKGNHSQKIFSEKTQIIVLYEDNYGKAVCKLTDGNLTDENFEFWPHSTPIEDIFNSIYERYDSLPLEKWPIICSPYPNFQAINGLLNNYPKLTVIMPYIKTGAWFTNQLNFSSSTKFHQILVASGNQSNDFTSGNKLDFIDSTIIEYIDNQGLPQTSYNITNVINEGGYTKIYSAALPWYSFTGNQVWFNIIGSNSSINQRYVILESSTNPGWVKIYQQNIGTFQSGTAKAHYLSSSTFSVGAKINQIMRKCGISGPRAVSLAKRSASNGGNRTNESGFGRISVRDAVRLYNPWQK